MTSALHNSPRTGGYSLLEMTVVLVLVGVLVGLAPVAWRAWQRAGEARQIQAELIDVVTTARSMRRVAGEYPDRLSSIAERRSGRFALMEGWLVSEPGTLSVAVDPERDQIGAAGTTPSGTCYFIRHVTSGPERGTGYGVATAPDSDDCRGELAFSLETVGVDESGGFGEPVELFD